MRQGDVQDLGTFAGELLRDAIQGGRDLGVHPYGQEIARNPDLHAAHAALQALEIDRRGVGAAGHVALVPSADLVEEECYVPGRPSERTDPIERGSERHETVAGHGAIGGFEAEHAAEGGGLPHRAAGVRSQRQGRFERRHRRRGSPARPSGDPVQVPGISRRKIGRVLGRGAHRELVAVGLPREHGPGGAQALHDVRVVGRKVSFEDAGPARGRNAVRAEVVLECDRHARERRELLAGLEPPVHLGRHLEGARAVAMEIGREPRRAPLRALHEDARYLDGAPLAVPDGTSNRLRGFQRVRLLRHTTCGTLK